MKPNSNSKASGSAPSKKKSSPLIKNGNINKKEYKLFSEGNLPPHHYDTVKVWMERLIDQSAEFSSNLDKKINNNRDAKLFHAKYFKLEDINNVLTNFYQIIDCSISGLEELYAIIIDYMATWKVALAEGIEDDSSNSSFERNTSEPEIVLNKPDEESKDSIKSDKTSDTTPRIRIRKICELNKLTAADFSPGNSRDASQEGHNDLTNGTGSKKSKHSGSSDECIIFSNDEDDSKSKKIINLDSDSSAHENLTNKKNISKKKSVVMVPSSDDDVCVITDISESETPKSKNENPKIKKENLKTDSEKLKKETDTINEKQANTINWDTSSSLESERSWVLPSKKKKILNKEEKEKRKRTKEQKKEEKDSDSEDDCKKLCNLNNLKRRRRMSSSSQSEKSDAKPKKDPKKKSKTSKPDEISLMECMKESGESDSSEPSEIDLNFSVLDNLKYLSKNEPNVDEFGKIISESEDSLHLLTDSSLDSLVEQLEATGKVKINRGTSKKKKEEGDKKKSSRRRTRDKLLYGKLTDTDTTEGEEKWQKHKMKTRIDSSDSGGEEKEVTSPKKENSPKERTTKNSSKLKKTIFSDDSDVANISEDSSENEKNKSDDDDDDDNENKEKKEEEKKENKKKRKRIQRQSDSSDDDGDPSPSKGDGKSGRRNIRKMLKEESLEKTTKEAVKEEEERKRRIAEKQKLYNDLLRKVTTEKPDEVKILEELVLDFDVDTKEPLVSVDKDLVKKLKPHQAQGIKFMWDACFESVKDANDSKGSGCILAHCMGLGKTLQVITLIHTLLTNEKVDVNRVLVVAPFSTVQNWVNEFKKWLKDIGSGEDFEVYNMIKTATNFRSYQLRDWERTGGVMVLGYNLFRTLVSPKGRVKAGIKKAVQEVLLDPGPDIVVCDEGHILKNEKTAVNIAMNKMRTLRRIVLTGTPLQNNLCEYHCMVQFVKPNLLGTRKEFQNQFVHPIQNGQFEDSTAHDVKVMKRRAHVLHKMLDGIVQRKDYNVLTPYLPPKYEYVIHVKLTEVQTKLYRHYIEHLARRSKNEGGGLFQDFQHLLRICTHPRSLLIHSDKEVLKKEYEEDSEGSLIDFIDDNSDSDNSSGASTSSKSSSRSGSRSDRSKTPPKKKNTRATRASGNVSSDEEELAPPKRTEWWSEHVTEEELKDISSSSKLFLFFTILKHCEEIGDKLLVFSQSLYTLDLIEHFLQLVDDNARKTEEEQNTGLSKFSSNWDKGIDYFRLDGGTSSDNRANWCKIFNSHSNTRARLFLISTRAGGLGINLTGANRVIIFDASWNPSFDVQSIFRVYRFGQVKPCFIYRFLSKGTMEEKIYERQVAKLSTSLRVIDEHQIDRHFTQTSLAELYIFNPDPPEVRETPILPKDRLMAELLQSYSEIILKHHQHDSLLENQEDEELNEEERKAAWTDFENEKNNVPPPNPFLNQAPTMNQGYMNNALSFNLQAQVITESLISKIKAQNPTLNEDMVKQRAVEVLQTMPFWRNQTMMNNFVQQQHNIQQQQQQYYQQQYMQQQQLMLAQQQAQAQQAQAALMNTYASKAPKFGEQGKRENMKNGGPQPSVIPVGASGSSQSSGSKQIKKSGGPSQTIEIHDD